MNILMDLEKALKFSIVTASANMSEQKRKRDEERPDGRPKRKVTFDIPPWPIKVSVIEDDDQWTPVLGTCFFQLLLLHIELLLLHIELI